MWIVSLMLVLMTLLTSLPAEATEPQRTIVIVSELPAADLGKLQRTINIWNLNPTTRMEVREECDPALQCATIYFSRAMGRDMVAVANPWAGYVKIRPGEWKRYTWQGKRMILCHELGHILGIDHNPTGCMPGVGYTTYLPGSYNRSIVPGELLNYWVK